MAENLQKQFVDKTDVAMAACLSRLSDEQSSVMLRSEKNIWKQISDFKIAQIQCNLGLTNSVIIYSRLQKYFFGSKPCLVHKPPR